MSYRLPLFKGFTTKITERRIALTPDGGRKSGLCLNGLLSWDFLTECSSGSKVSWGLPLEHTFSQLARPLVYSNLTSPVVFLTPPGLHEVLWVFLSNQKNNFQVGMWLNPELHRTQHLRWALLRKHSVTKHQEFADLEIHHLWI